AFVDGFQTRITSPINTCVPISALWSGIRRSLATLRQEMPHTWSPSFSSGSTLMRSVTLAPVRSTARTVSILASAQSTSPVRTSSKPRCCTPTSKIPSRLSGAYFCCTSCIAWGMAMRLSGCGLGPLSSKWAQAQSVPASAAANNQQYPYRFTVFTNSDTGLQAIGISAQKPAELEACCWVLYWTPPQLVGDALDDRDESWSIYFESGRQALPCHSLPGLCQW